LECLIATLTIGIEVGIEAFGLKVLAEKHAEVFVVFAEQNTHTFFHNSVV
jgi:hypothetical protein